MFGLGSQQQQRVLYLRKADVVRLEARLLRPHARLGGASVSAPELEPEAEAAPPRVAACVCAFGATVPLLLLLLLLLVEGAT